MIDEYQLEDLKKKLYRLHFLLTENEDSDSIQQSLDHFRNCFTVAMNELANFLSNEYSLKPKNNNDILESSYKHKLFNKQMTDHLKTMLLDFENLESGDGSVQIYNKIKESYAGNLQMIYDMLSRMGQDADEE